jgi:hypothetical protein
MTECTQESCSFTAHFSRRVEAGFTAGQVTSDGGAFLLVSSTNSRNFPCLLVKVRSTRLSPRLRCRRNKLSCLAYSFLVMLGDIVSRPGVPIAKPEFLWPGEILARSPLPDGRVDLGAVVSGYINSGFAVI